MRVYRYPLRSLIGDYLRALTGLAVGFGVLVSVPLSPTIGIVFSSLALLFLVFGLRTLQRHMLRVAITNEEICSTGFTARVLPWSSIGYFKLRYYGTRRQRNREDSGSGFMQLTLNGPGKGPGKGHGASLRFESSIEGFEYIAWRAAKAARENRISLDPASTGNLLDLGIDADSDQPAPGETT